MRVDLGETLIEACERLAQAAPAFMIFNELRIEAQPGDTASTLYHRWYSAYFANKAEQQERSRADIRDDISKIVDTHCRVLGDAKMTSLITALVEYVTKGRSNA